LIDCLSNPDNNIVYKAMKHLEFLVQNIGNLEDLNLFL